MIIVTQHFRKHGYTYTFFAENRAALVYQQLKPINETEFELIAWEVHKKRTRTHPITGITCLRRPSDEDFGTWAWSFQDETSAKQKFEELSTEHKVTTYKQNFNQTEEPAQNTPKPIRSQPISDDD